jgi:hypothetical protein
MKKYRQNVIPEASTEGWTGLKEYELRRKVFKTYQSNFSGKKIFNESLGITIEFERAGARKTSHGSSISPQKACIVPILDRLLRFAEYSNWGNRKSTDPDYIIGFLNFKVKVKIDGKTKYIHLVVRVRNTGKFHYSLEVNIWK